MFQNEKWLGWLCMLLALSNCQSLGQLASTGSGNGLVPLGSKPLSCLLTGAI